MAKPFGFAKVKTKGNLNQTNGGKKRAFGGQKNFKAFSFFFRKGLDFFRDYIDQV